MAKPNYATWDLQDVFTEEIAAYLCCDIEPGEEVGPFFVFAPAAAQNMSNVLRQAFERKPGGFTRSALREWAERTGRLTAMPFLLTPEERPGPPKPGPAALRADRECNRNAVIGLLTLALVKRGGPGFRKKTLGREDPNLSAVAEELQKLANDRGIDLQGLSLRSLTDHLNAGLDELGKEIRQA